jgi:hypothetical protein
VESIDRSDTQGGPNDGVCRTASSIDEISANVAAYIDLSRDYRMSSLGGMLVFPTLRRGIERWETATEFRERSSLTDAGYREGCQDCVRDEHGRAGSVMMQPLNDQHVDVTVIREKM